MKQRIKGSVFLLFLMGGLLFLLDTVNIGAQTPSKEIYVANQSSQCEGKAQCFFNDAPDTPEAIALNKAISFAKQNNLEGANIRILAPYEIRTNSILIDYPLNLIGENDGWLSTSSSNCTQPMLILSSSVTIRNIYLTDGICTNPSRDLLHVNSASDVRIDRTTLEYGNNAIVHQNNLGNLTIRFSEIRNNDGYALSSQNTEVTSKLVMVANNIFDNGNQTQVACTNNSFVDHNYWGADILPSQAAPDCGADNEKVLGAKILTAKTGVAATLLSLSSNYPANDYYGFSAKSDQQTGLYVVNHGNQKPFASLTTKEMTSCGNFFDVFLPEGSSAQAITMRFRYDKNQACQQAVQTISLCGSGRQERFPLLWLDPKTSVTDGWDNVGGTPQTEAGSIFSGQETRCDFANKTIEVVIDNDGRPDLLNDLFYTPMTVGFEVATVAVLRPVENVAGTMNIAWGTTSEINTGGFRVVRSETEDGTYLQIGQTVPAEGSNLDGHIYGLDDSTIAPLTIYYYKLEVIGTDGEIQQTIGPVRVETGVGVPTQGPSPTPTHTRTMIPTGTFRPTGTIRPTSTRIPTRTSTPFLTATNSYNTPRPTYVTQTYTPSPEVSNTPTPTDAVFNKPTSNRPTSTIRPTRSEGELLDKRERPPRTISLMWLPIVLLIIGLILGVTFLLTRKK